MTARPRVCVFQVPPYDPDVATGGAEVVATQVVAALEPVTDITILCGYDPDADETAREQTLSTAARVLMSFPLGDGVWNHGCVTPHFDEAARRHLSAADLLITIERSLTNTVGLPTLTCLGGVAYPHGIELARGGAFDVLVVPSPYVRERAQLLAPVAPILAVTNGIDLDRFAPPAGRRPDDHRVRLLLAARPEPSKGLLRAFALASCLRKVGIDVVLQIVHRDDLPGAADIRGPLSTYQAKVPVELMPWRPRSQMPDLYHQADLTLCLAEVPEGFGLTAAESVACGTPVLAHPAGFLADMFPPDHGMYLVAEDHPVATWVDTALGALADGRDRCLRFGRSFAQEQYDVARARTQYRKIALSLAAQKTRPRSNPVPW